MVYFNPASAVSRPVLHGDLDLQLFTIGGTTAPAGRGHLRFFLPAFDFYFSLSLSPPHLCTHTHTIKPSHAAPGEVHRSFCCCYAVSLTIIPVDDARGLAEQSNNRIFAILWSATERCNWRCCKWFIICFSH